MRVLEVGLAALLAAGGVRSLWRWAGTPFDSTDALDHVWFALYRTGRAGLWFAFSGLFAISASIDAEGRAFVDEFERFRWYALVPLGLAGVQLLAATVLRGRGSGEPPAGSGSA